MTVPRIVRGASGVLLVALASGCAARLSRTPEAPASAAERQRGGAAAPETLSQFMQKIRHLSARPPSDTQANETLESRDPALAAELLAVAAAPTAQGHRLLAEHYRQRGVPDAAYRHFNRALALNPRDADAYEGRARVWRDWGFPELALPDAHRATYHAPQSASARNTIGTVMQALGREDDARTAYELASRLDRRAAYPASNLCYLAFLGGRMEAAIGHCERALQLDPSLTAARNNLALVRAASGRMDLARQHFVEAGDQASALYNTGMVYLASGDSRNALAAFDGASRARPTFALARRRAQQIRERLRFGAAASRLDAATEQDIR